MTAENIAQLSLAIAIVSMCLAASCAVACCIAVSRSTRQQKLLRELTTTPPSDAKLASVQADLAQLFSTLASITSTVKRLSGKHAVQEHRERQAAAAPPPGPPPRGAPKSELRRFYGFTRDGPEFAKHQLALVPSPSPESAPVAKED